MYVLALEVTSRAGATAMAHLLVEIAVRDGEAVEEGRAGDAGHRIGDCRRVNVRGDDHILPATENVKLGEGGRSHQLLLSSLARGLTSTDASPTVQGGDRIPPVAKCRGQRLSRRSIYKKRVNDRRGQQSDTDNKETGSRNL